MQNYNPEITEYIENAADFAQPILTRLREIIHSTCPDIVEKLSWSRPHYYYKGKGMLVTDGLKERVTFGVWFGELVYGSTELSQDAKDIYEALGQMKTVSDIPDEKLIMETIRLAMQLIDEGRAQVKTEKKPKAEIPVPPVPDYFSAALAQHKQAESQFAQMSPSHRREYLAWITEAKTEETRNKRIAQAIEQIQEGKSKHWKYQK